MATRSLPVIIQEAEQLTRDLLESGGEITPDLETQLVFSNREIKEKLDTYGFVLDSIKARQEFITSRMAEWDRECAKCEKVIESLRSRIHAAMEVLDMPEVHGYEYTFKLQANPARVVIDDEAKIPIEYTTTEIQTTVKISKREILDAFKDGQVVPGAHIERSTRLVTKVSQRKDLTAAPALEKV